jgi:hypothetical protein
VLTEVLPDVSVGKAPLTGEPFHFLRGLGVSFMAEERTVERYITVPSDFVQAADDLLREHLQVADWDSPACIRYRMKRAELPDRDDG